MIPKSESESPHAFPKETESPEGLAESPPLRSRVGDGAALPDPASPGILQQKGTTEEFFCWSQTALSEELNELGDGKTRDCFFGGVVTWGFLFLFLFFFFHPGKFPIFPLQGCSENLSRVIITRRGPHELFPYTEP